ncbi:hypothetical protein ACH5RR_010802 [Cinchona calisaya]|uniref:Uncharacterized protein n=1 Tax=Cinchona calisaya TaxID=153742 RepID=A0ABD3AJY3_9GENT
MTCTGRRVQEKRQRYQPRRHKWRFGVSEIRFILSPKSRDIGSSGPVRVKIVGVNGRDSWSEIGRFQSSVCMGGILGVKLADECVMNPGKTVFDAGGTVDRLERREAHLFVWWFVSG